MVGIVIASHGEFASGILQSAQMIVGEQENTAACTLMPSEGPDDLRGKIEKAIASFDDPKQILIICDLWGGTPFNQASAIISGHEDTWAIVTGLNLPLLIEAFSARFTVESAQDIAKQIMDPEVNGIKVVPESLAPVKKAGAQAAKAGSIPEGTVIGNGKIEYVMARIDTRLLHGQVATTWTKLTKPNRIIAVSDAVAGDDLRKQMIEQAAPPGTRANVVPIDKMIKVDKDPRFGGTKAMLLFETPQDALRAIEGGVQIKKLNLGSMAHSLGKAVVTKAVAMGEDDVKTIEKLVSLGVEFDVRKVPGDSPEKIENMLKKAKTELGM